MDTIAQLRNYLFAHSDAQFIELLNQNPGIDLNRPVNRESYTLLHIAAFFGKFECVKALVTHDINVNLVDSHNETALFIATKNYMLYFDPLKRTDYANIIKHLIESGADLNIYNDTGKLPFGYICMALCTKPYSVHTIEIFKLFVRNGACRDFVVDGQPIDTYLRFYEQDEWANYIRDYRP